MSSMRALKLPLVAALLMLSGCQPSPGSEPVQVVIVTATPEAAVATTAPTALPSATLSPTVPPTPVPTAPPTRVPTALPTAEPSSTPLPPTAAPRPTLKLLKVVPTLTGHFAAALDPEACAAARPNRATCGWFRGPDVPSPDGRRIAWSDSSVLGDARLYIANADGSGQVAVRAPSQGLPLAGPVWSPDSRHIAFTNCALSQPGGGDVYVVNADGSGLIHLASYVGYHDGLAWSADSSAVAYSSGVVLGAGSSTTVTGYRIYAARADGSGAAVAIGDGCQPIWVP